MGGEGKEGKGDESLKVKLIKGSEGDEGRKEKD